MSDAAKRDTSGWLTSAEAAEMMRTSVHAVRQLVRRGRLKADYRGKRRGGLAGHRFKVETIQAFLDGGGQS
jgi:hypothetical protein